MIDGPISVVAPCGPFPADRFAAGVHIAQVELGLDLVLPPDLQRPWRYLAADDDHRLAQLEDAFSDPSTAAIWAARGGYGLTRLLGRLDIALRSRKPLIGFSDVTALHAARWKHGVQEAIHGPVLNSLPITAPEDRAWLRTVLRGEGGVSWDTECWLEGGAVGPLIGGNLCLLAALCGTPWQLDVRGAVLLLEEVAEPAYRLDRMLRQLLDAGGLAGVAAVVVGELPNCALPPGAEFTLPDVFREVLAPLGVPVAGNAPVGHAGRNRAFHWGTSVRVTPNGVHAY